MDDDYREQYTKAITEAVAGGIGVYKDFDKQRQQDCFRILSGDRKRLLTFTRREGITAGHVETLQTLKSPKPLYQMVATGEDVRKVTSYLDRIAD